MAARTVQSAATERAYLHFGGAAAAGVGGEEFDESDVWGAFSPAPAPRDPEPRLAPHHRPVPFPAARIAGAAHGSLPVNIPDWSKILGVEYYRRHHAPAPGGDWEPDDEDAAAGVVVPPHELAWRRRAASLSLAYDGGVGRTLKVRDEVWKRTTGFQD